MKTLTLQVPDALDADAAELTMILATQLYERAHLSLGQAVEMVGYSKRDFMEVLGSYGVSLFNYSPEELARDVANAGWGMKQAGE